MQTKEIIVKLNFKNQVAAAANIYVTTLNLEIKKTATAVYYFDLFLGSAKSMHSFLYF